ncbi:hypothetical protein O181_119186 [Austropuccinia psidii MF-1]|uniref:Integrase catalytic domain-containing protein n=1 Tax=Austropuccinia psidii MF-1 TaxID=1389203 RepID=A0A9Q3PZF4_9BASI|nr:hypothetical protein [Austropuccinia psidii MF-1]
MDWVTCLPPGGDRIYNACLLIVDRFSNTPIFLPCHEDDTPLLIWNRVVSWTGIFTKILNDRDTKFPQADGLAERMIQTLEDMVRKVCAYGL